MLTRVTITGADDWVSQKDLAVFSVAYPFVEWGILFSMTRAGVARYPSPDWVRELLRVKAEPSPQPMKLAAHACGSFARAIAEGDQRFHMDNAFARVQLNGIACGPMLAKAAAHLGAQEMILQAKDSEDLAVASLLTSHVPNLGVLYDVSGGRGLSPESWPVPPHGLRCGYAGGITPDNVVATVETLLASRSASDFWIDMESGVRTDDAFDIEKVAEVLKRVSRFVEYEKGSIDLW